MVYTELRKKEVVQIEFVGDYTADEFVKLVKKSYKDQYIIKSYKTDDELVLLFIYKDVKVFSHVQVFELLQFKK